MRTLLPIKQVGVWAGVGSPPKKVRRHPGIKVYIYMCMCVYVYIYVRGAPRKKVEAAGWGHPELKVLTEMG